LRQIFRQRLSKRGIGDRAVCEPQNLVNLSLLRREDIFIGLDGVAERIPLTHELLSRSVVFLNDGGG